MHRNTASLDPKNYLFIYFSFIHVYLLQSPKRSTSTYGEKTSSPSTEPHADGRPTNKWVWPGSLRGSLSSLLSLPQCHAAVSTIHSTLARIDQSSVGGRVPYNPHHGIPSTTVTVSHVTQDRIQQSFLTAGPRPGTAKSGCEWFFSNLSFQFCKELFMNKYFIVQIS